MLESAIPLAKRGNEKNVARERCRFTEETDLPFAQSLQVAGQSLDVRIVFAGERNIVRDTARTERDKGEVAHFDRMIDQFVVIGRAIESEAVTARSTGQSTCGWQRRGDPPRAETIARGRAQVDQAWRRFLPDDAQKETGAIEEAVRLVEVRAPHRQVPGVDFGDHLQNNRRRHWRRLPGVLVEFFQADGFAIGLGADRHDMASKIANHVTAGNPRRQCKTLPVGRVFGNAQADFEAMGRRVDRRNRVADRRGIGTSLHGGVSFYGEDGVAQL